MSSRLAAATLAGLALGSAGAQAPVGGAPQTPRRTYQGFDDVIAKMPWNVATDGPLFAVCPLQMATGSTLDDLNRRRAVVGRLTAIVPKTMVTVSSRFTTAPNLYEGLPQEAKVTYLARSFTAAQWAKATGIGIGIEDLQGEQIAVFDSILPKPLVYKTGTVTDTNGIQYGLAPEKKTLTADQRAKVKLRIVRHLWLQIALANNGGYTATDIKDDMKPGDTMPFIQDDKEGLFGQQALVTVPNVPRKSQLALSDPRLGATLLMVPRERVAELLARVTRATGLRLVADPHYANMPIVERGANASACDMLGALTLGVAGTFRRLGDAYVLTNDLEGMAAHQARIAVWEDALTKEVERRVGGWRSEIANNAAFGRIPFSSPLYDALSPAEQENVAANDQENSNNVYYATKDANKTIREAMRTLKNGLDVDRERVGISSSIRYEIILPDVGRAWWRGWLGNTNEYQRKPYVWAPRDPKPVALPLETKGAVASLVLRADTPKEATAVVARVARLGIGELLLETHDAETLRAAVAAGAEAKVKVGLALRPWALAAGERSADPDRTATGEHGAGLAAAKDALGPLGDFWRDIQAFAPPTRELIAPLDPATNVHIARAAELARTKGLSRVAALDLYPAGYGKEDNRASGSYFYSNAIDGYVAYGYTDAMRAAFLRTANVDPLDVENGFVRTEMRLDGAWGGVFAPGQPFAEWQKAKGAWSHERTVALCRALRAAAPSLSLTVPAEPPKNHLPPLPTTYLFEWSGVGEPPLGTEDYGGGEMPEATAFQLIDITDDRDPAQRNRVANRLRRTTEGHKRPIVLDLSSVPASRLETVLSGWLRDATP